MMDRIRQRDSSGEQGDAEVEESLVGAFMHTLAIDSIFFQMIFCIGFPCFSIEQK